MRTLPPAYASLILFIAILVLGLSNAPVFADPDTAWHLAAGDLIRAVHSVPTYDPWSFTARGERWYNLSWLADAGMSALFALGGFSALFALTVGIFAGTLAFMAHFCLRRGASMLVVFLMVPLALLVLYGGVIARPTLCSLVMTIAFYHLLHRYRETGRLSDMVMLPALMALWVNLHGGFLLAFPVMGLFLLEAAWERSRTRAREYGFIIALCLGATLINPYGWDVYYGAYRTLASASAANIAEWQPVAIGHNLPMTLLLLGVLAVGNAFDKRIPLVDRMIAVVMMVLWLSGKRYGTFAAFLLMPYISLRLTFLLQDSAPGKRLRALDEVILRDMQKNDIRIMGAVMAAAAFAFICAPAPRDVLLDAPAGFPARHFPVAEAAFIEAHYPSLRFFNDYNIGGYLDYLWRGKVKVFVDGRASSLYSEELLKDYFDFTGSAGFGGRAAVIAGLYRLDGVIILNDAQNAALWEWNPHWQAVYHGKVATVYIRKDLVNKKRGAGGRAGKTGS